MGSVYEAFVQVQRQFSRLARLVLRTGLGKGTLAGRPVRTSPPYPFWLCALAAFAIVCATIWSAFQPSSSGPNLGTGALITGLLGAPFLIWRTVVAQKTVDLQREGHITDRIAKAVEQLGAEKTVKRIHEIPRYQKEDGEWRRDENGRLIEAVRPDGTPLIDRETHELTVPNIEVRIGASTPSNGSRRIPCCTKAGANI